MSDAVLTNEQTLKLLLELATNDGFRHRYQEKPAAALLEIGVPPVTIANLDATCLAPCSLKGKESFVQAHQQLMEKKFATAQSMAIPSLRLSAGGSTPQ
jgi:putative modified peptide